MVYHFKIVILHIAIPTAGWDKLYKLLNVLSKLVFVPWRWYHCVNTKTLIRATILLLRHLYTHRLCYHKSIVIPTPASRSLFVNSSWKFLNLKLSYCSLNSALHGQCFIHQSNILYCTWQLSMCKRRSFITWFQSYAVKFLVTFIQWFLWWVFYILHLFAYKEIVNV